MRRRLWIVSLLTGLLLGTMVLPAFAVIKVLVTVTGYYFGDTNCVPTASGTKVCAYLVVDPWGADVRSLREGGTRTALTASAACGAIKTLIINRAATEYPAITLVADDIGVHGCLQ
jgi:hypothetical protein